MTKATIQGDFIYFKEEFTLFHCETGALYDTVFNDDSLEEGILGYEGCYDLHDTLYIKNVTFYGRVKKYPNSKIFSIHFFEFGI